MARRETGERQTRRVQGAGRAVVLVAAGGRLRGQALPKGRTGEAEGVRRNDAKGMVRAELVVDKAGPGLPRFEEPGKTRVRRRRYKDLSGLTLFDETRKPRLPLTADKNGSGRALIEETGTARAELASSWKRPEHLALLVEQV